MIDNYTYATTMRRKHKLTEKTNHNEGVKAAQHEKNAEVHSSSEVNTKAPGAKAREEKPVREVKGFLKAVPVILLAIALFLVICFITGEAGAFGSLPDTSQVSFF